VIDGALAAEILSRGLYVPGGGVSVLSDRSRSRGAIVLPVCLLIGSDRVEYCAGPGEHVLVTKDSRPRPNEDEPDGAPAAPARERVPPAPPEDAALRAESAEPLRGLRREPPRDLACAAAGPPRGPKDVLSPAEGPTALGTEYAPGPGESPPGAPVAIDRGSLERRVRGLPIDAARVPRTADSRTWYAPGPGESLLRKSGTLCLAPPRKDTRGASLEAKFWRRFTFPGPGPSERRIRRGSGRPEREYDGPVLVHTIDEGVVVDNRTLC
jgi:hypothetical protein